MSNLIALSCPDSRALLIKQLNDWLIGEVHLSRCMQLSLLAFLWVQWHMARLDCIIARDAFLVWFLMADRLIWHFYWWPLSVNYQKHFRVGRVNARTRSDSKALPSSTWQSAKKCSAQFFPSLVVADRDYSFAQVTYANGFGKVDWALTNINQFSHHKTHFSIQQLIFSH